MAALSASGATWRRRLLPAAAVVAAAATAAAASLFASPIMYALAVMLIAVVVSYSFSHQQQPEPPQLPQPQQPQSQQPLPHSQPQEQQQPQQQLQAPPVQPPQLPQPLQPPQPLQLTPLRINLPPLRISPDDTSSSNGGRCAPRATVNGGARNGLAVRLLVRGENPSVESFTELSPRATDTPAGLPPRRSVSPVGSPLLRRRTPPPAAPQPPQLLWPTSPPPPQPPQPRRTPKSASPALQAPQLPSSPTAEAQLAVAGLHVLIVDDELSHRRIAGRMLERLGCTHDDIEDGDDLVRALVYSRRPYDAILLDIVMKRSNGLAVCRNLRAQHIDLPVIAATAYHTKGDDETFCNAGFDAILDKPFSQRQLALTLMRAVAARASASPAAAPRPSAAPALAGPVPALSGPIGARSPPASSPPRLLRQRGNVVAAATTG